MISAVTPDPPRWLPARITLAGLIAAGIVALVGGGGFPAVWSAITCQTTDGGLLALCGRSSVVLFLAVMTAVSAGFSALWLVAQFGGPRMEASVGLLGRALSLFPIAALAWSFVGWWIGSLGWPVETLMPVQLDTAAPDWRISYGSTLWEYLAPALVLAVPLMGAVVGHRDLPLRTRLQALCLYAPAWLIIVEDVLHFMGWGAWMAQGIRAGDVPAVASGLAASAWFIAALCLPFQVIPARKRTAHGAFVIVCWLPWPLWAIAALSLSLSSSASWALLWLALLILGAAGWYRVWRPLTSTWRNQLRWFVAWCFEVLAGMLVWGAAACSLKPTLAHQLGDSIAQLCRPFAITSLEATAQSLADPALLFRAGGLIMLAALFFSQISRILRPCPPSPSSKSAI